MLTLCQGHRNSKFPEFKLKLRLRSSVLDIERGDEILPLCCEHCNSVFPEF